MRKNEPHIILTRPARAGSALPRCSFLTQFRQRSKPFPRQGAPLAAGHGAHTRFAPGQPFLSPFYGQALRFSHFHKVTHPVLQAPSPGGAGAARGRLGKPARAPRARDGPRTPGAKPALLRRGQRRRPGCGGEAGRRRDTHAGARGPREPPGSLTPDPREAAPGRTRSPPARGPAFRARAPFLASGAGPAGGNGRWCSPAASQPPAPGLQPPAPRAPPPARRRTHAPGPRVSPPSSHAVPALPPPRSPLGRGARAPCRRLAVSAAPARRCRKPAPLSWVLTVSPSPNSSRAPRGSSPLGPDLQAVQF